MKAYKILYKIDFIDHAKHKNTPRLLCYVVEVCSMTSFIPDSFSLHKTDNNTSLAKAS